MTRLPSFRLALSLVAVTALAACGGDGSHQATGGSTLEGGDAAGSPTENAAGTDVAGDPEVGRTLYHSKGCPACHTIGSGRLVGPDLAGVTDRRERDWILGMILRPDSMLKVDETARQLLAEYFTPMAPLPMSDVEAASLYAFLVDSAGGS